MHKKCVDVMVGFSCAPPGHITANSMQWKDAAKAEGRSCSLGTNDASQRAKPGFKVFNFFSTVTLKKIDADRQRHHEPFKVNMELKCTFHCNLGTNRHGRSFTTRKRGE